MGGGGGWGSWCSWSLIVWLLHWGFPSRLLQSHRGEQAHFWQNTSTTRQRWFWHISLHVCSQNKMFISSFFFLINSNEISSLRVLNSPQRQGAFVQQSTASSSPLLPSSSCRPPRPTPNPQARYHNIFTRVPNHAGTAPCEWVVVASF